MISKTLGLSVAVLALIGEIDAVSLEKHRRHAHHDRSLLLTNEKHGHHHKRYDEEDTDKYMAESLAEAEKEWADNKGKSDIVKKQVIKAEDDYERSQNEEDPDVRKLNIRQMTEDLIDGALTSSTQLEYDGNEVTVKPFEQEDAAAIRE